MGWELYFHEGKLRAKTIARQAKSFCQRCPVVTECLTSSLEHRDRYGIWGGLTPKERGRLLRLIDLGELTILTAVELIVDATAAA